MILVIFTKIGDEMNFVEPIEFIERGASFALYLMLIIGFFCDSTRPIKQFFRWLIPTYFQSNDSAI